MCDICIQAVYDERYSDVELSDDEKAFAQKISVKEFNAYPNSSFAVIEPGAKDDEEGKAVPRNARHLPHHTKAGGDLGTGERSNKNLDMSHLRVAFARVNQIKPITDSISESDLRKKAENHLEFHRSALKTEKEEKKPSKSATLNTLDKGDGSFGSVEELRLELMRILYPDNQ